jgi:hypothetical protein
MAIDNTKGEIKLVRGSGPPILTIESEIVKIADRLYLLTLSYRPTLPVVAEVIGVDLTRRLVRFQVVNGHEVVYSADGSYKHGESYALFSTQEHARNCALHRCDKAIKEAEQKADAAIEDLKKVKALRARMAKWPTDETNGDRA